MPVIKTSENARAPKDDKNLEEIASNTNNTNETLANLVAGFNNMAKALRDFGVNVSNQSPTVINTSGSSSRPQKIPSSVNANVGNTNISDFRIGLVEAARMRPA